MYKRQNYGCVKTKIKGRGWTHWYKLPFIDYNDAASSVPEKEIALGSRLLKKMCIRDSTKS